MNDFNIIDQDNKHNSDLIPEGYLRVTECLKPFNKFDGIDPCVLANAADRGTRVHKYCELYANNMLFEEIDEDCKGYVKSFIEWFDGNNIEVFYTERRINHKFYKISGCIDMLVQLEGTPCIIDIKTSAKESLSWALQTAAYRMLADMVISSEPYKHDGMFCNFAILDRMALMLSKTGGKAKEIKYQNHSKDIELYIKCLEVYRYFNP